MEEEELLSGSNATIVRVNFSIILKSWLYSWKLATMALRVCLNTTYFAENLKFIIENTIAKYFLKDKTLYSNTVHTFLCFWLIHEQCYGTSQKKVNATSVLGKRTLSARLDSAFCTVHTSAFHTLWFYGHCSFALSMGLHFTLCGSMDTVHRTHNLRKMQI